MVFSSVIFLFRFLPLFFLCYFVFPGRMRNLILFLGSILFYAWGEPVYVVLMLISTLSDYVHGLLIEKCYGRMSAKLLLFSSIVINLGMLGFFKYSGLDLPLPVGISFYTFQTMSYTIDVYRGEVRAQKNLLDFAVFVTLFPQLIAGPIVQYKTIAEELRVRHVTVYDLAVGAERFVAGLAKKVLLANGIGVLFTQISAQPEGELTLVMAWLGMVSYAFQIYFDFSGYSDMAIGLGRIMGFHFPENFRYPYTSKSITEFWRRWHISLSSWFRDYVYIPLGGNRKGLKRQLLNIGIVWSLTGIWHGAGLNFLLWGMWFALFLMLEKLFLGKWLAKLPGVVGFLYTAFVVLISWCFFSLEEAGAILRFLKAMFGMGAAGLSGEKTWYLLQNYEVLLLLLAFCATPIGKKIWDWLKQRAGFAMGVLEPVALAAVLLLSVAGIVDASYNPFLYFRF